MGNHCVTFILPALIKFYSFKAKSIFSHENDNSCHILIPYSTNGLQRVRTAYLFFLSMSKVGLPLMGDTAGFSLLFSALLQII